MKTKIFFGSIFTILIGIMVVYNFTHSNYAGKKYVPEDISAILTPAEKKYLEDQKTLVIGFSDQIAPFAISEGIGDEVRVTGLIIDFVEIALSQIGQKATYVFLPRDELERNLKNGSIHGAVVFYSNKSAKDFLLTYPIIPTKGKVAIYGNTVGKSIKIVDTRELPSIEAAVNLVIDGKLTKEENQVIGLLGHEPSLHYFIRKYNEEENFTMEEGYSFAGNFCIGTSKDERILYEILNKAIYKLDENKVLSSLNGEFFGISYPIVNSGVAESISILFTIILASVMAAFYIFYANNKTLYEELATRMEQVLESQKKEKTMERQMIQDNKMVAIGQLAAGVAHEIRNPLGLIRNYCYVLKTSEGQKEKAIAVIESAVDKSGKIIDNLLNFSKSSNNQWIKIKMNEHINAVLSLQRNRAVKEGIQLDVICREDLEMYALLESMDMILINLTSNAMDAMAGNLLKKNAKVTVDCKEEDGFVTIKVRDNGEGIEEEIINEIFNPFFTTKEQKDGCGLGLYIVYNEIKKMNGEIYVDSQVSKGTEFTVKIPLFIKAEVKNDA